MDVRQSKTFTNRNWPISLSEEKIIEEAILDAMKSAHEVSTSTMKERMEDLTGGFNLNLPGMGDKD